MESENQINGDIMEITTTIKKKYPELAKYIEEFPETIVDDRTLETKTNNLKNYYYLLLTLVKVYRETHTKTS